MSRLGVVLSCEHAGNEVPAAHRGRFRASPRILASHRGYDPGALLGDRGYGTQAEIRVGSRLQPNSKSPAGELYAFWDHARVKNLDTLVEVEGKQHLDSLGVGARVNFNQFVLDTALALPLTQVGPLNEQPAPRFLISLTTRLWPWRY